MGTEPSADQRTLVLEQGLLLGFAVVAGLGLGYLTLRRDALRRHRPRRVVPAAGARHGLVVLGIALVATVAVATALGPGAAVRALLRSSVTGVLRGEADDDA